MFTQSIVAIFLRAFVINARSTEFIQVANITGNRMEYNDAVNNTSFHIPPGIFDFIQLFPISDQNLLNHSNTLKNLSLIPDSFIFDSNSLLMLLMCRYKFFTLIAHVLSRKIVRYIKRVNYIIINE